MRTRTEKAARETNEPASEWHKIPWVPSTLNSFRLAKFVMKLKSYSWILCTWHRLPRYRQVKVDLRNCYSHH